MFLGASLGTIILTGEVSVRNDPWCLLDTEAFVESPSLSLGTDDRPGLLLANRTTLAVSLGRPERPDWILEPVPATALPLESRALEFGAAGVVHVLAYAGTPDGRIAYLRRSGGNWTTEVLSPDFPRDASLAIDGHGEPHVAMRPHNATNRLTDITYGRRAGGAWTYEKVQGIEAAGGGSAIALSPDGTPHLAYGVSRGSYTATLRYAVRVGGAWSFEDLSENLTGAQPPGLVVNSSGAPRVVAGTPDGVEVFTLTRVGWTRDVVGNGTALNAAVALGPDEEPHLAYFRADPSPTEWRLTYARHTTQGWESEDVVTGHHIGGIQVRVDRAGTPHLAFYDITADRVVYGVRGPCPSSNSKPIADAGGPYVGTEGSPVTLTAQGSSDPDGDALKFRWDFDADGVWDTAWSSNPSATHVWGDDWSGSVRVEVSDGNLTSTAETSVVILNSNPVIGPIFVDTGHRVHRGCDERGDDHDHDGDHGGRDDRDDDDADCGEHEGAAVTLRATAVDAGSDDLTFRWDFGDGTNASHVYFNDGTGPDPFPSPGGVFPTTGTNETTHVYQRRGDFMVTLTVTDDDGGRAVVREHVSACNDEGGERGDHGGDHGHEDVGCGGKDPDRRHDDDGSRRRGHDDERCDRGERDRDREGGHLRRGNGGENELRREAGRMEDESGVPHRHRR